MARRLVDDLAKRLGADEARDNARAVGMAQFVACIRNARAHGGIMYLDDYSRSSEGTAAMLLFVSAKQLYPDPLFDENKEKWKSMPPVTES